MLWHVAAACAVVCLLCQLQHHHADDHGFLAQAHLVHLLLPQAVQALWGAVVLCLLALLPLLKQHLQPPELAGFPCLLLWSHAVLEPPCKGPLLHFVELSLSAWQERRPACSAVRPVLGQPLRSGLLSCACCQPEVQRGDWPDGTCAVRCCAGSWASWPCHQLRSPAPVCCPLDLVCH